MSDQREQLNIKEIFCAKCQEETPHIGEVDGNGEFVFTCTTEGCDRFVKLPANVTPEDAQAYFAAHKEGNIGQVSLEEQERKLQTLLGTSQETPADDQATETASEDTTVQE